MAKAKKMKIDNIDIGSGVVLAPMESVTDLPFRIMCKRMGADLVYTEFIASEALIRDVQKSFNKMLILDEERPVAVQIFGSRVESMVESARIVEDAGADILDINFGCWVKKVVGGNCGAAFLKDPSRLADMAEKVASSVSIPVTAKTRLGWDANSIVIEQVAEMLNGSGIKALALHCRTREMGMKGNADWSWIDKVKAIAKYPVILNGDVCTPDDVVRAYKTTQCDGVMIGRAAVGNPFLFKQIKNALAGEDYDSTICLDSRIQACIQHLELNVQYKGYPRGMLEFRKHYSGYLKGLFAASNVRQKLVVMEDLEQIKATLLEYQKELEGYNSSINQHSEV